MSTSLIERLERAAKEVSVWRRYTTYSQHGVEYDLDAADLRELLEEAAKEIREQSRIANVLFA